MKPPNSLLGSGGFTSLGGKQLSEGRDSQSEGSTRRLQPTRRSIATFEKETEDDYYFKLYYKDYSEINLHLVQGKKGQWYGSVHGSSVSIQAITSIFLIFSVVYFKINFAQEF